ncbi:DUF4394 domain-containing protein [Hymenobacter sp. HDW8]|uniref:DUF4394 domain-containing protein n=1 Tax=Hymenobacter sp. HDW8 TaxID=2714932 RepID=UPI00140B58CB|nr:DUF4394 domain-containing protein [Hymenobacter sp. HDW8]QIL76663.1 DUF4394 domain-containing protein [Hymenobacter sp. HDW8]
MLKHSSLATWGAAVLLMTSLSSCEDILEQYFPKPTPPPVIPTFPPLGQDIAFYALSNGIRLDAYSTANAATRTSSVAITGLGSGETLLAIDFRPATGQLYGVSSASRLYVINQNTGVARAIGAGPFTPALGGNLVGFDFNPTVDRIRLVTSTGQNLRLNPETGTAANTDGAINGAAGATITGVAYTNNTNGAATTALYAINTQNQQLTLINPPNDGTLVSVGNLNLPVSGNGGFDIDAKTGTALGLYSVNGQPTLFTVDLANGTARPLAQYATNAGYTGIAIPTQPVAYSVAGIDILNLVIFNPTTPSNGITPAPLINKPITGLGPDESVKALDFRPATGQLYALVAPPLLTGPAALVPVQARLFTINPATGAATLVAPVSLPGFYRNVTDFDFNPVTDRIRIFTDGFNGTITTTQNLRVNPVTGEAVEDTPIAAGSPIPFALAYSNNAAGATSTSLYGIHWVLRDRQESISTVYQFTSSAENVPVVVGNTQAERIIGGGMDIGGMSNTAYAMLSITFLNGRSLYTVDLQTGRATSVGYYPAGVSSVFALGLGF